MPDKTKRQRRGTRRRKRRDAHGAPPGTLVPDKEAHRTVFHAMAYGPESFSEKELHNLEDVRALVESHPVTWINVDGVGDVESITRLGKMFGLHELVLEDVNHLGQRPKVEQYGEDLFAVARMVERNHQLESEQLGLYVGDRIVLTFQDGPIDSLDVVRKHIREGLGRIRRSGPDYLLYSLLDAVVDAYFPVLEQYGEYLEQLEDEILERPRHDTLARVHKMKRELFMLRRIVWPQREAINNLLRLPAQALSEHTRVHLQDCHDHANRILDLVDTYLQLAADLMQLNLSNASHRMNEVMRFLTAVATVFIPMTLIAGVYGMNFDTDVSPWNMPELTWYYGYPFALGLMVLVSGSLWLYIRRRRWLE